MKIKALILAAAAALALASCSPDSSADAGRRVIDYPYTTGNNTKLLTLTRLELTDSATILHIRCDFSPGRRMTIASTARLDVNGKRYKLKGARGLNPDSMITMPESGRIDFALEFYRIPRNARTFTFLEAETPYEWHIWGIDATGERSFDELPAGLPETVLATPSPADTMPGYVMRADSALVNVHVLDYEQSMGPNTELCTASPYGWRVFTVRLDATGRGSMSIPVHGTTRFIVRPTYKVWQGITWIAPGDTVNIYVRPADTYASKERNRPGIFTDGTYGTLTAALERNRNIPGLTAITPDTAAGPEALSRRVVDWYARSVAALDSADIPEMLRRYKTAELACRVIEIAGDTLIDFTHSQVHRMLAPIDMESADLLMVNGGYFPARVRLSRLTREFGTYWDAMARAASMGLTDADRASLRALSSPFFLKSAEMREDGARKKLELDAADMIMLVPYEVAPERLLDTIVYPYRGKTVIVNFWDTWRTPCSAAFKKIEPLKQKELDSDKLVWIYIASETSPLPKYLRMIPEIKGVHYRLARDQIRSIYDRFGIDGIPYCIIADPSGRLTPRPDLTDPDLLIRTLTDSLP